MVQRESQALRDTWHELDGRPCLHPELTLECTEKGYLTGVYVCAQCGQATFNWQLSHTVGAAH